MFEDLTSEESAALQAISDTTSARFAKIESVKKTAENSMRFRCLHDAYGEVSSDLLLKLFKELQKKYLVELKVIRESLHVGLTEDGEKYTLTY